MIHKKIRTMIAAVVMIPAVSGLLVTTPVLAANAFQSDACNTLNQVTTSASSDCGGGSTSTISSTLSTVLNILSFVAGVIAFIMIVVSGFRFITSQGDSSAVAGARTALIYALAGLAVVALSQAIVHFVLGKI